MRVISLLASGTEIVCALGAGSRLVGRSHECDHPSWVQRLPALSRPAFDITASSEEIDAEVTRRIRSALPLYLLDNRQILDLEPDLILTQSHCEVCAVTPGDLDQSGCLVPTEAEVLALTAGTLDGIFADIQRVADALDLSARGRALVNLQRLQLEEICARCAAKTAPTVVLLEWIAPIFAMANWGPDLVHAANGRLLLGTPGEHSHAIPWQRVLDADPEILIVAPCGFSLDRALAERHVLESLPGYSSLQAVRNGKVAYADGNLYFNRSGMTAVKSAEILAEILHSEVFGDPTEGVAWRWL